LIFAEKLEISKSDQSEIPDSSFPAHYKISID